MNMKASDDIHTPAALPHR